MPEEVNTISINISDNDFEKKSKYKKTAIIFGASFTVVLLIIIGVYLFVKPSNYLNPTQNNSSQDSQNNSNSPKNEKTFENPINGMMFTPSEAANFKDKKPIAVMLNNYVESRPSAGVSYADVVYEAVAESGITRLMPIYWSNIPEKVRSIRSARYYFVELAAPYHPHYIHWGAAHVPDCQKASPSSSNYCPPVNGKVETEPDVDAYDRIVKLGLPNLDGGNYSCDATDCAFGRDPEKLGKLPLEHTAFVRLPLIYDLAKKIRPEESWQTFTPFTSWKFKDDAPMDERGDIGAISPISYIYWETPFGFDVKWDYDKESNSYSRTQGGVKVIDDLNQQPIMAKDIIIRFTDQKPVGDKKNHLYHTIVGTGDALIFRDGQAIKGTWSRSTHEAMDVYKDTEGNEIEFTRGQIWVQLVPTDNKVSYETIAPTPIPTQ